MKRRGLLSRLAVFFAVVLTVGSVGTLPAKAGASTIVVDDSSFAEKLDDGTWSNPDSNVSVENKMLVFPESSTSETRLITKSPARASEMEDELVNAKATIRIETLPNGQKFVLALGLSSIEAISGESGNVEVQFTNNGGIKAKVVAYGDSGEEEIISNISVGKLKQDIKIEVSISKTGALILKTGGSVAGKGQLPVSGEGRVGFLQTGSCAVKIKDVTIMSYQYDTPENSDLFEDFESGSMNLNLLTSKMTIFPSIYRPCYAKVMEYDDNQVFMCSNSGETYIGTLYKYSNFELSFDIPYIQALPVWTEEGEAIKLTSGELFVGWGFSEPNPLSPADYMQAEQGISFREGTQIVPDGYSELAVSPEKYPFFSPGYEGGVSIKISVIDTEVVVYVKWIEETNWTEVLRYHTGTKTFLGYIQLWMLTPANIAIDNLKIVNKDANPKQVTVDAQYEYLEILEDYKYEKSEDVYKDLVVREEETNWYLLIPVTAGVCMIVFGMVFGITELKRRKKGDGSNEKKMS